MTDITELAQSLKAAANREMISRDLAETSSVWQDSVTPESILALVEALELKEEQRANWFQMAQKLGEDLDAAEKRIAELESEVERWKQDAESWQKVAEKQLATAIEMESRSVTAAATDVLAERQRQITGGEQ